MTPSLTGGLLGGSLATGLLLVLTALLHSRRPNLSARLEPYLRDVTVPDRVFAAAALVSSTPVLVQRLAGPYLTRGAHLLERVLGGDASIRRRLVRSGSRMTTHAFRVEQLLYGAVGLGVALLASLLLLASGAAVPLVLAVVGVGALAGVLARDQALSVAVTRRERRLLAEFPAVADMLALSLAAGEGTVSALERIVRITRGELSGELGHALADAHTGASLTTALGGIADRTALPSLQRFVDGIAVAVERGTPLADVLRSQAADVREADRRRLIETGGRKDILMMVPVVFLVLPVTILFALYPGFVTLRAIAS